MKTRERYVREKAQKLLKDSGQIGVPVDLTRICAFLGFQYMEVDIFPDSLSALCIRKDGQKFAAVNRNHHPNRKRFSLAHEIGHWVLAHMTESLLPEVTLDNPPNPNQYREYDRIRESEANQFAGELLVPSVHLRNIAKETMDVATLAKHFHVSPQVVTIRLMNTKGLI